MDTLKPLWRNLPMLRVPGLLLLTIFSFAAGFLVSKAIGHQRRYVFIHAGNSLILRCDQFTGEVTVAVPTAPFYNLHSETPHPAITDEFGGVLVTGPWEDDK